MANVGSIDILKAEIDEYINQNDSQAITGQIMNDTLNDMVDTIVNNYEYMSEDEYEELPVKKQDIFYFTYEDE